MHYVHPLPPLPDGDLWVFGYGSLMWRPGFDFLEMHTARVHGYHRSLCVWSWEHRGTQQKPGLVFGLDLGGACIGRLFRVAETDKTAVADYLYAREMVTPVYRPGLKRIRLPDRTVTALTFTIDRRHAQYAGRLEPFVAAAAVREAIGYSGPNWEYVLNTLAHLRELGIRDRYLEQLALLIESD